MSPKFEYAAVQIVNGRVLVCDASRGLEKSCLSTLLYHVLCLGLEPAEQTQVPVSQRPASEALVSSSMFGRQIHG